MTTNSFIWHGEPPSLIYCEPEKGSSMKIELLDKSIWYIVRFGKMTYDSFFGKTAHSIEEAKEMCQEIYEKLRDGKKPELMLHNNLP